MYDWGEVNNMFPVIDKKATGACIRRLMEEKGYSYSDIQEYLCLSCVQTVYRWTEGVNIPSIDNLYALSKLFNVSMDDMIQEVSVVVPFTLREAPSLYLC